MGARVFIATRNIIEQTMRMKRFELVMTIGNPRLYMFHDEYYEEQLGLMVKTGPRYSKNGMQVLHCKTDFYTKRVLEKIAACDDERIKSYYDNLWIRDTPYWREYKKNIIEYSLAKRDYLRACVDAEILKVVILKPVGGKCK